jgi:flagellar operon protein
MADVIKPIQNQKITPVTPALSQGQAAGAQRAAGFQEILQSKISPTLKFSAHALERLQKRNVAFTQESLKKLTDAVTKAESKGCRESLVLMGDLALIVSIKNKTVITAIDGERIKENIFTNIDSAIIV